MRAGILIWAIGNVLVTSCAVAGPPQAAHQSFVVRVPPKIVVNRFDSDKQRRIEVQSNINVLVQVTGTNQSLNQTLNRPSETIVPSQRRMTFVLDRPADRRSGYVTLTIVPLD